jgi:hypothetical protein
MYNDANRPRRVDADGDGALEADAVSRRMNLLVSVGWTKQNGTRKGIGSCASGVLRLHDGNCSSERRDAFTNFYLPSRTVWSVGLHYALVKGKDGAL